MAICLTVFVICWISRQKVGKADIPSARLERNVLISSDSLWLVVVVVVVVVMTRRSRHASRKNLRDHSRVRLYSGRAAERFGSHKSHFFTTHFPDGRVFIAARFAAGARLAAAPIEVDTPTYVCVYTFFKSRDWRRGTRTDSRYREIGRGNFFFLFFFFFHFHLPYVTILRYIVRVLVKEAIFHKKDSSRRYECQTVNTSLKYIRVFY